MLQSRREKIAEMIQADRVLKVSDLMRQFDVSIETIRRDLEYLEKQGLLTRVYGGAVLNQKKGKEPSMSSGRLSIMRKRRPSPKERWSLSRTATCWESTLERQPESLPKR